MTLLNLKKPLNNNNNINIIIIYSKSLLKILLLISFLFSINIFNIGCSKIKTSLDKSTDKSSKEKDIIKVKKQDLIQKVSMGGSIEPKRRTLITAPYNGYIKQLFVKMGDKLQKGNPIVSITQTADSTDTVYPIRAPYAGTVVQIKLNEGEFAREADTENYIVRIDDLSKLYVNATIGEIDRIKIKLGQEAIVKLTAISNRTFKAVISYLSLASQEKKDRWDRAALSDYIIRLEILDTDPILLPGMSVIFDIISNKKSNVLTLPHEFIYKEDNNYYVIMSDGSKKDIKVGTQNEEVFEITEGLKEGDQVKMIDFTKLVQNKK
ncbi:MAG: efflux RND transporter periplasmic adaptor subunit [Oligoflexia bacterium]|nr:efflux RND transporter periplasmic adaptor subunit [Oligoflexia bacterium]